MLYKIYKILNFPNSIKVWIKNNLPLILTRQSQFRKCGSISELYFWVVSEDIDTVLPIQNFFSIFFPYLNTNTTGTLWVYDRSGNEVFTEKFFINSNSLCTFSLREKLKLNAGYGTLMWKIDLPKEVRDLKSVRGKKIYFADRGYISYLKDDSQISFIHGVDRYAVFQENESSFDYYYPDFEVNRVWVPEFPVCPNMQKNLKVIMINRSKKESTYRFQLYSGGNILLSEEIQVVPERGTHLFEVRQELLKGDCGHIKILGLSTPWGRPAVFRTFDNGSISLMHC